MVLICPRGRGLNSAYVCDIITPRSVCGLKAINSYWKPFEGSSMWETFIGQTSDAAVVPVLVFGGSYLCVRPSGLRLDINTK